MSKGVKFSSLWQSLVDDGYNVGTYEEFVKKLEDSSRVSSLESFLKSEYNLDEKCTLLMSPIFGEIEASQIAEWILQDSLPVRMQIQMHKYIWEPETKGV